MMQGERPWSIHATSEEVAAQEFLQLPGLGEAAAMTVALTAALGGCRHGSLASLTSWLAAGADHLDQLQAFLLDRYWISVDQRLLLLPLQLHSSSSQAWVK